MANLNFKQLDNIIDELESERISILNQKNKGRIFSKAAIFIFLIIFLEPIVNTFLSFSGSKGLGIKLPSTLLFLSMFVCVGVIAKFSFARRKGIDELKSKIFPIILNNINPTFKYLGRDGISSEHFRDAGFYNFAGADRKEVEDVIEGIWNGYEFKFGEVTLKNEHRDSDGGTRTTTLFSGQFFEVEYPKNINGLTTIAPKTISSKFSNVFNKLDTILLEDIEFNELFLVNSTDEVEARYLLTPQFIEKIKNLKTKYNCNKLHISFSDKYIYVLIDTHKNLLEIDINESFYNNDFIVSILKDFSLINDICECLDLQK